MKKLICIYFFVIVCSTIAFTQNASVTQNVEKKKYFTQKLGSEAIKLDGIPDEIAWDAVNWGGDFIQYQPNEGKPPSVQTQFKILYDDKFLYLGYRCYDSSPDSIVKRMGRRDEFPGDWVEINIDSYHDLRTAFSFTLSVSGVRNDEFVSNNGNFWDTNWNPIWFAKTHVDDKGWTAEAKIPFSQLRYGNEKNKVWGIQVMRRLFRKEERSTWQYIPQNSGVWVSGFGELHGLNDVPSQKQVEIAPYIVAQTAKYQKEEGNPFATGSDSKLSGGVDGKIAVTSDLILDFTVNPDFGQVEADPSQVRIDGFQNFFEERRPFFMESRNIFDYQLTGSEAGGDYDADLLFYSRRIGGSPHGYPDLGTNEYADVPQNTSILGAAKFSGKTKDGWSIGILESITQREKAIIDHNGERRKELVEPLASYFVGRMQKDIKAGNTVLGGIFTGVNREKGLSDQLHSGAYSGGLDFLHFWKNRTWYVRGNAIFSHVQGTKEAIFNTQTSFEHLFQRPNAVEVNFDANRTSLTGAGGTVRLGKIGGKAGKLGQVFKFETGLTFRSPELELNDVGFMLTANEINHFTWAGLHYQKSFSVFRNARLNYNHWSRWDFGGQFLYQAFNVNAHATFKNNWQVGTGTTWNPYEVSNNALRGGSAMRRPAGMGQFLYIRSDSRKKVFVNLNGFKAWGFDNAVKVNDLTLSIRAQPMDALNFTFSTGYRENWRRQDQYVTQIDYLGQTRTIVSEVSQKTLRFIGRLNYNITPDLTLQYYGQPFITRPLYQNFAYVTNPLHSQFDNRFHRFTSTEIRLNTDGNYVVDENTDGKTDYQFSKPDFNFVQFRSNLVLRWEYVPGSELFLVWSQGSTPDVANDLNTPLSSSLFDNLFEKKARNIWLVKMTYRFLK
ncbi:MAG: carbohydrate binding family 9 domain-containing protein [Saprospiraceae bacterium]|nr:carbohydrate binding family 9 domain-containing protein [Saprospiraceae bacterium]